jgi:hypothetical protein
MQSKVLGTINVAFNAAGQLLIIYSAFIKYLKRKWEYNESSASSIYKLQESP